MRIQFLIYWIISIFLISCSINNKKSISKTKISILGSVHFPTDNVNADSIYNVLLDFKPDVVLAEIDEDKMYEDFTYKNLYNENEIIAIVRYKFNHPKVQIRPIDLFKRNEKRQDLGLFSEASAIFQNLNKLNNEKSLNSEEQLIWDNFSNYWDQSEIIGASNLRLINSKESDQIIDSLINYQYNKLLNIVSKNKTFEKNRLINAKNDTLTQSLYFQTWVDFEKSRNLAISENILNQIKNNPHKRIIISVGYKHRFFVKKYLEEEGIIVTEFYD